MKNAAQIAAAFATVLAAAACAPKQEVVTPPTQRETPPPPVPQPPPPPPRQVGPTPGSIADFQRSVGDRVFFDYDQFELRSDAREVLQKQAAWLQRYPSVQIRIAGNADERGTREYNLALGARRAASVKSFLVSLGVSASRLETISYGKENPIDPGSNEDAWAKNRNAHSEITSGAAAS